MEFSSTLLASLLICATFALSGAMHAVDRSGLGQAAAAMGVPERFGTIGTIILPFVELGIAVVVAVPDTRKIGNVLALILLLLFSAIVGRALSQGVRTACHCFGALSRKPLSWRTLVRNALLILVCVVGLLDSPLFIITAGTHDRWLFVLSLIEVAMFVALVTLSVVVVAIIRQQGRLLERLDALSGETGRREGTHRGGILPGSSAPEFILADLDGNDQVVGNYARPTLLIFVDPGCGPCAALVPMIKDWSGLPNLDVFTVSSGAAEENSAKFSQLPSSRVLIQRDWEVASAFEIAGTPSAVLIDAVGAVESETAVGKQAITALVAKLPRFNHLPVIYPRSADDHGGVSVS